MDVLSRARRYLEKCPSAISGQGGHDQTYRVAVALVHGFCLDFANAMALMTEYNARCQPAWNDDELRHKVREAMEKAHDKPRGFLLSAEGRVQNAELPAPWKPGKSAKVFGALVQSLKPKVEDIPLTHEPPESAIVDGARALIKACFKEGEGVRIVPARLNEEGKEVPDGVGPCLSREEWLKRLDAKEGNPNSIWKSEERTGIYIGINPLRPGGSKDADVLAYRHALIEFDKSLSLDEQWNLYVQTNLPCAAVIYSGGQSLHAWVRVDAKDASEFAERVKVLHEQFGPYGVDVKNKNPSRLSRLPNCVRFDKRQELWALGMGAPSFLEWLADREAGGLGQEISLASLLSFDAAQDPNLLLGANRWLCRGSSCVWIGQSGIGKSALAMQAAVLWAVGRAFFGIAPVKPLKSLIIQHENDEGDLAEMLRGVIDGLALSTDEMEVLKGNLVIVRNRTHAGAQFVNTFARLIAKHQPDMGWIDPLYVYMGGDISKAEVLTEFLVTGLGPVLEASGVCLHFMHHTPKPPSDTKSRKGWTVTDYSYSGLGSSALTNWVRATMILLGTQTPGIYQLMLGKRGKRAGATDLQNVRTTRLWLAHSDKGICWVQVAEPVEKDAQSGRPAVEFDPVKFCEGIAGEFFSYGNLLDKIEELAGCKNRKAKDIFREQLKFRLKYDSESKTYTYAKPN